MARLSGALSDRARVVRATVSGPRIEGRSPLAPVRGDWKPCRLVPADDAPEREDEHGRRTVLVRAQLVAGPGLDVRATDELEVRSRLLGDAVWKVTGEPQRVARGARLRAVVVPLQRTLEPVTESAVA